MQRAVAQIYRGQWPRLTGLMNEAGIPMGKAKWYQMYLISARMVTLTGHGRTQHKHGG
jgi:hypothetical protein